MELADRPFVQTDMRLTFALLLFITTPVTAQDQWKNVYSEVAWKERDAWQKADEIIDFLALPEYGRVADIGCHEGYMTVKLSAKVPNGTVYSVDINTSRLEKLAEILKARNIYNVRAIHGEAADPKLPIDSLDGVLIVDTYHEMKSHDEVLKHVMKALRHSGRLVICEPIAENRRTWTRSQQEEKHELNIKFALEDLRRAGFQIVLKRDPFVDREKIKGDKMWIIVARKP